MLAIFDNDGTICDTQDVEGRCYAESIRRVLGRSLPTLDWTQYPEPTSRAIVQALLAGDPKAEEKEAQIKAEFCRLLREEQAKFPGDFSPILGAVEFLAQLERNRIRIAIATGCFDASAEFKLQCCGVELRRYPHATASDTPRRAEVIRLAAQRAGFDLNHVIYFGDAPWDVRASAALNIPMIGIGRRCGQLRELGLTHVFRDFTRADTILEVMTALRT